MNVLIIGSGGREHAMAWKAAQSPRLENLFIAPGNPGTAALGENVDVDAGNHPAVARFCQEKEVGLVMIGPEASLAGGLADALRLAGIKVFGPSKAAAQIEASKAFAKQFMVRHAIPTPRHAIFNKIEQALQFLRDVDYPVVIKASGLASGKGVILPETNQQAVATLEAMLVKREFGAAGKEVVIEERLSGPEISLMAFTDGVTVLPMLPAQDHKRLLDGDRGPNTGGMGAYAPAPTCTQEIAAEVLQTILQPAVAGLQKEGMPFIGVLYAGLILTDAGPRVLEFNCRFGDPEAQAVLPLLDSDLLELAETCADGRLAGMEIRWKGGAAACVVLATEGYPGRLMYGRIVKGSRDAIENGVCFHAGTRTDSGKIVTSGGRVLSVTAWDDTLAGAVRRVYAAVDHISFHGMQYRRDIAHQALKRSAYTEAGVSIDAGNRAVELMRAAVDTTYGPEVLAGIGAFGGLFDSSSFADFSHPVLVASIDGVGSKARLATQARRYQSIGHDLVNHCINDILVQGARPLFFLDYFASAIIKPEMVAEVVAGISEACREAGCALIGGETTGLPGVFTPAEFDLAGTVIGVVERERILPRTAEIRAGDILLGLASSGPHTSGYSLIRKVFADVALETVFPELGASLGDILLVPHRSYLKPLAPLLGPSPLVKALAHITGGGFIENIPRVLPANVNAVIRRGSWPVPPLWPLIQKRGDIPESEMYRVFNMGIGMVVVVDPGRVDEVRGIIPETSWVIGSLVEGKGRVILE